MVSELVALARPRYHVAGGEALHYVRPPFAHKDLGAGIRVTRFVGLAPLNHPSKAKVREGNCGAAEGKGVAYVLGVAYSGLS